jgi:hypothetical protein
MQAQDGTFFLENFNLIQFASRVVGVQTPGLDWEVCHSVQPQLPLGFH